jgi:nucleoside-diphosphate-sugar epimerase
MRVGGEVMNIACGRRVTVNELAVKMAQVLGRPDLTAEHAPERMGDVKHSLADLQKAKDTIDYQPIVDVDRGLEVTCQWYRETLGSPASR